MERPENCIITIFGASGDLTRRKLVPGLFNLYMRKMLPERFAVFGVSRSDWTDQVFRDSMAEGIRTFAAKENRDKTDDINEFIHHLYYHSVGTSGTGSYEPIKAHLRELDDQYRAAGNYVYYLSTPPSAFGPITRSLAEVGLNTETEESGWRRLIVEKPFGYDLESARKLNAVLHETFQEEQIYRIDHYLGKETVQNMLVFRFANGIFEPLWNRNYVERVEITSAESIGVGSRGGYYDGSGALRDMFQNHLLQVIGMVGMESPSSFSATSVRNETVKVFKSLRRYNPEDVATNVVRGQYTASTVRGEPVRGYRQEEGVPDDSMTETYVGLKFYLDNWRWAKVPFYVRTGKRLPTRVTEVVIDFKKTPHRLFGAQKKGIYDPNKLIIRIQPDEGILMKFNMKLPGGGFQIKTVNMDFHYSDLSDVYVPQAYERLLLDCMLGDATLYARGDAVEACWDFVKPIQDAWANDKSMKMFGYPAGTWGPKEATDLIEGPDQDWRFPCKNLASDGEYCEL